MRKRGKPSKRPTPDEFFKLYDNKNITVDQIAKIYDVAPATIYNWASQMNNEKLSDKQIYNRLNYNRKVVKNA